ncbi:MAG: hypothetical protein GWM87_09355, partial [Xanthomonadales bacterium]|nr:hypothetical protein [Xanthomonadales bacterium]NIX13115.1 hypothetical protein [Xanthomonadales bacterium]
MADWQPFPHDDSTFRYEGNALQEAWDELHRGDRAPYPDRGWVQSALDDTPGAAPGSFDGDLDGLAVGVQDAWRAFHAGRFGEAVSRAADCGLLAHAPANKAAGIYATYLEADESRQHKVFTEAVKRAELAIDALPEDPN